MLKDIKSVKEIEKLIHVFYKYVLADELLKPFFTEAIQTNFEKHIPIMVKFWENALFYTGTYTGNPLESHRHIHAILPFRAEHFERWLTLFIKSVDENYVGANATAIKNKATSISSVMKFKMLPMPAAENDLL